MGKRKYDYVWEVVSDALIRGYRVFLKIDEEDVQKTATSLRNRIRFLGKTWFVNTLEDEIIVTNPANKEEKDF